MDEPVTKKFKLTKSDYQDIKNDGWLSGECVDLLICKFVDMIAHLVGTNVTIGFLTVPSAIAISFKRSNQSDIRFNLIGLGYDNTKHNYIFISISNFDAKDDDTTIYMGTVGSHWALMVIDVDKNTIYTFDSLEQPQHSSSFYGLSYAKMAEVLQLNNKNSQLITGQCPQQINSYDCGIYTAINALKVMEKIISNKPFDSIKYEYDLVVKKGTQLKELVENQIKVEESEHQTAQTSTEKMDIHDNDSDDNDATDDYADDDDYAEDDDYADDDVLAGPKLSSFFSTFHGILNAEFEKMFRVYLTAGGAKYEKRFKPSEFDNNLPLVFRCSVTFLP